MLYMYLMVQPIVLYLVYKILSREKFKILELFLLMLLSIPIGGSYFFIGVYMAIPMIFLLGGLAYSFSRDRSIRKTITFICYASIIVIISDHIASLINVLGLNNSNLITSNVVIVIHQTLCVLLALLIGILVSFIVKKIKEKHTISRNVQALTEIIGVVTVLVFYTSIFLGVHLGNNIELIQLNLVFFGIYIVISLIAFFMYISSLRNKYEIKQKEIEENANQMYIEMMEKQFNDIKRFRHDYKNILSSLNSFFVEEDFIGLKEYYYSKILPASSIIEKNDVKLGSISNIKVREIKSLLASKLITAQEEKINVVLEVKEEINGINLDSIKLVRILGIFLDNAIEELKELDSGTLNVAVYADNLATHIIIQNDCRENLPKLHVMRQQGFSTKGDNRGEGLNIVKELLKSSDNVNLSTSIQNEKFTQKLAIYYE